MESQTLLKKFGDVDVDGWYARRWNQAGRILTAVVASGSERRLDHRDNDGDDHLDRAMMTRTRTRIESDDQPQRWQLQLKGPPPPQQQQRKQ